MSATAIKPVRIQRSRRKGSKLESPNGLPVVVVTRPASFGNPFVVGGHYKWGGIGNDRFAAMMTYVRAFNPEAGFHTITSAAEAVEWYREYLKRCPSYVERIKKELAGKNLACWCKPDAPCHADVLLELANRV